MTLAVHSYLRNSRIWKLPQRIYKGSEDKQVLKFQQLQHSFYLNRKDFWFCKVAALQLLPGIPQAVINSPPVQPVEPLKHSEESTRKSKFS